MPHENIYIEWHRAGGRSKGVSGVWGLVLLVVPSFISLNFNISYSYSYSCIILVKGQLISCIERSCFIHHLLIYSLECHSCSSFLISLNQSIVISTPNVCMMIYFRIVSTKILCFLIGTVCCLFVCYSTINCLLII